MAHPEISIRLLAWSQRNVRVVVHPDPNETEGDTMRGYVTATGMAIGLLAIWAALLPFVA